MVIALNEVADEPFLSRAIILAIVALAITAARLRRGRAHREDGRHRPAPGASGSNGAAAAIGRGLVRAMPKVLSVLSTVGIVAMLWVGGHILLAGVDELGWHAPYELLHHLEEAVDGVPGIGGLLAWLVDTLGSALVGLVVGAVVVAVMHVIPRRRKAEPAH